MGTAQRRADRAVVAALLCAACGGGEAAGPDGSVAVPADAAPADATDATDATPGADAGSGFPKPGFGALSGDCDVLDDELTSVGPAVFRTAIAFERPYTEADLALLTAGGQEIIADDNAGGSSLLSEVFAFELLHRCELATLLKTETEIEYDAAGSITDLLVELDATKIGVSVTRAVAFPFDAPYTEEQAAELVTGKLADILESTANVSDGDRWAKQILVVVAFSPAHADAVEAALAAVDPAIAADTVVWVLATNGADDFIYCDGPCDSTLQLWGDVPHAWGGAPFR